MKQKDIVVIVGAVIISGIFAFVISGKLISTPANRQQTVGVVPAINDSFHLPDSKYFNTSSIDPTKLIQIGNNSNQAPFNTPSRP